MGGRNLLREELNRVIYIRSRSLHRIHTPFSVKFVQLESVMRLVGRVCAPLNSTIRANDTDGSLNGAERLCTKTFVNS